MHGARIQAKPRSIWVLHFTQRQTICQTQSSSVHAVRKTFSRLKLGAQASRRAKKSAVQNPRVDAVKTFAGMLNISLNKFTAHLHASDFFKLKTCRILGLQVRPTFLSIILQILYN